MMATTPPIKSKLKILLPTTFPIAMSPSPRRVARIPVINSGKVVPNEMIVKPIKTGKRTSLRTASEDEARQIVEAKNQAERQPVLNLQIAKAYLAGTDNGITTRTWQHAIEALTNTKQGANQVRWKTVAKDKALSPLLPRVIIETQSELLLRVLQTGTVSTNVYLRRLHNFCVDMNWLPWPLVPKRQWPAVRFKDVDWPNRIVSFFRMKTRWRGCTPPQIRFGKEVEEILAVLPKTGPLFPYLSTVRAGDRATEFKQRCVGLGIQGVSLHSYRYAWAERAKTAGYPERFAQMALGHNSKAVHRAYAKKAQVTLPPLEEYERKIVQFNPGTAMPAQDGQEQTARVINAQGGHHERTRIIGAGV